MRIVEVYCDRCKELISGIPFCIEVVDPDNELDLCPVCTSKFHQFMDDGDPRRDRLKSVR